MNHTVELKFTKSMDMSQHTNHIADTVSTLEFVTTV